MKHWMPFFSIEIRPGAPWYKGYILAPMLGIVQVMALVFFLTIAAKLAWGLW